MMRARFTVGLVAVLGMMSGCGVWNAVFSWWPASPCDADADCRRGHHCSPQGKCVAGDGNSSSSGGAPLQSAPLAVGANHTCVITSSGALSCRGDPAEGQLGGFPDGGFSVQHPGPFLSVAAGFAHTCAITSGRALQCWGRNTSGQAGRQGSALEAPQQVGVDTDWERVASFGDHTCAIRSGGKLFCFGDNYSSQSGTGGVTTPATTLPAAEVATGRTHTCMVGVDGGMFCMGTSEQGALGRGAGAGVATDFSKVDNGNWRRVCAGTDHTCGIRGDGSLWCWGSGNPAGGGQANYFVPVPTSAVRKWAGVTCGDRHTCAWTQEGELFCFGENPAGVLGNGTVRDQLDVDAGRLPGAWNWAAAGLGGHMCGLRSDGNVACWGSDALGAISATPANAFTVPGTPTGAATDTQVAAGAQHACANLDNGHVNCWGSNTAGQVLPSLDAGVVPRPIQAISDTVSHLGAGVRHSCASTPDEVVCWGDNSSLQLGGPPPTDTTVRTTMPGDGLALGETYTCASADGWVQCAGTLPGQTNGEAFSPPDGGSATIIASVAAGGFGLFVVGAGQVIGWSSVLTDWVPTNVVAAEVAVGRAHACAILPGSTVACWGENGAGQLGVGDAMPDAGLPSEAFVVRTGGADLQASSICCGSDHSCAVRESDGMLFCWGAGESGQLGLGLDTRQTSTAMALDAGAGWNKVSCGRDFTCATRVGGGVYCWGGNNAGQLGNGRGPVLTPQILSF